EKAGATADLGVEDGHAQYLRAVQNFSPALESWVLDEEAGEVPYGSVNCAGETKTESVATLERVAGGDGAAVEATWTGKDQCEHAGFNVRRGLRDSRRLSLLRMTTRPPPDLLRDLLRASRVGRDSGTMVPWQISASSARRLSPPRRHHRRSRRGRSEAPARRSLIVVVPRRSRLVRREGR